MVMTMNSAYLMSIVILFFGPGISCRVIFPEDGFRFNCGVDICTYPLQYCDISNAGLCKYCNDDLCNTDDVPQQCYTTCAGNKSPVLNTDRSDERPEFLETRYQSANREKLNTIQENLDTQFLMLITVLTLCSLNIVICMIAIFCIARFRKKQLHRMFDKKQVTCAKNDRKWDLITNNKAVLKDDIVSDEEETTGKQGNPNTEEKVPLIEPKSENSSLLPNNDAETRSSSPHEIKNTSIPNENVRGSPESLPTPGKHEFFGDYKLLSDGAMSDPCGNTNPKIIERSLSSGSKSDRNIKYPVEEENQTPDDGCYNPEPHPPQLSLDDCNKLSPRSLIDSGHFSEERHGTDK